MTTIHKSALVRYSAEAMFRLVDDIDSYADFLPWCHASRVLSRSDSVVEAELVVARAGFHKSFATRNTIEENQGEIRMTLLNGPFEYLEGVWTFLPLREDASKIALDLDFELTGTLSNLAFGPVFNHISNTLVDAFSQRARELYGR